MGNRIEIELTSIAHGGEALGRHAGKVVFVPYGAPEDRAIVEIVEERERWARARLLDLITPSPHRVQAPCPHYGECAGCQLQHLSYAAQLSAKRLVVQDQLTRLGHISDVLVRDVIGMPFPWQYRNQAQLYPAPDGRLGIKAGNDPQAAGIDECLLLHPLVDELLAALDLDVEDLHRVTLRAGTRTADQMIIFETVGDWAPELEADMPISCLLRLRADELRVLIGDDAIGETLAGRRFRVSALSPFPVNTDMAEKMVQTVESYLSPRRGDLLLDAGSGVGVTGLSLSGAVGGIIAIEENGWAVSDYMVNAAASPTAGIVQGTILEGLPQIEGPVDIAVVNPPRTGVGAECAAELDRLRPRRVAYVAPDPAMLARDVQPMTQAGYRLIEIQPFDASPQTSHVHLVSLWERDPARR